MRSASPSHLSQPFRYKTPPHLTEKLSSVVSNVFSSSSSSPFLLHSWLSTLFHDGFDCAVDAEGLFGGVDDAGGLIRRVWECQPGYLDLLAGMLEGDLRWISRLQGVVSDCEHGLTRATGTAADSQLQDQECGGHLAGLPHSLAHWGYHEPCRCVHPLPPSTPQRSLYLKRKLPLIIHNFPCP